MSKVKLSDPNEIKISLQYCWNTLLCEHINVFFFAQQKTISFSFFKPLPDSDASEVTNNFLFLFSPQKKDRKIFVTEKH